MKAFAANLMLHFDFFFLGVIAFHMAGYSLESNYFDLVWILAMVYFFFIFLSVGTLAKKTMNQSRLMMSVFSFHL